MELSIQNWLRNGTSLDAITKDLGIMVKSHDQFPGLYLFNYHQTDSPKTHPIVMECRGLILDSTQNWNIVHFPMMRFFNDGEALNVSQPITHGYFLEKLDGSLIGLSYYNDQWIKSTRGVINGDGNLMFSDKTFNTLITETWKSNNYIFPEKHYDLSFELTTPENRHITRYMDYKLSIICARRKDKDFIECDQEEIQHIAKTCGFSVPKKYDINKISDAHKFVRQLDGRDEGCVFVSSDRYNGRDFYRVKIINPAHRSLMKIKDSLTSSLNGIMTVVLLNKANWFIEEFPEYKDIVDKYHDKYNVLVNHEQGIFEKYKSISDRKEFALSIKDSKLKGYMFMMYEDNSLTIQDCIQREMDKKSETTVAKKFIELLEG